MTDENKKIVVIGGTGLIGSKLVANLAEHGFQVVAASPNSGVNTITGEGLAEALKGASIVVDVSNSPSFDEAPATEFFKTSTGNLLREEGKAGVKHHIALSVVGTGSLAKSEGIGGYFRAKLAQEKLIEASPVPFTIVHATQFFEFGKSIAESAVDGSTLRVPPAVIRPMAADDVAKALAKIAVGPPLNATVEIGGPEEFQFEEFVRLGLAARDDEREVVTDPKATYFGAPLTERELVPGDGALLGETRLNDWLQMQTNNPAAATAASVSK